MKKILTQYLYIFLVAIALVVVMLLVFPDKKNQLEYIEEKIKEVQEHKKVLTEKEKQLEKLATEKDWEEVDKEKDK
jgi:hypothetical protein